MLSMWCQGVLVRAGHPLLLARIWSNLVISGHFCLFVERRTFIYSSGVSLLYIVVDCILIAARATPSSKVLISTRISLRRDWIVLVYLMTCSCVILSFSL